MLKRKLPTLFLITALLLSASGCSEAEPGTAKTQSNPTQTEQDTTAETTNEPVSSKSAGADSSPASLPKPPITLEEILAYSEAAGQYAGSNYDEAAVKAELDKLSKDMDTEEVYARILHLIGENYQKEKSTFDRLEQVNYRQALLSIDPADPASAPQTKPKANIEVILDASGSMAEKVNGGVKMDLAKKSIQGFLESIPMNSNVGLRVFGHKGSGSEQDKPLSCAQTELVYPLGSYDQARFQGSLQQFGPKGWTGIATALEAAREDLKNSHSEGMENIIYLVTDGIETCGGNPVEVAKSLHQSEMKAVINLIGFDVNDEAQRQLKAVAEAGGGTYTTVKDKAALENVFKQYLNELYKENSSWMQQAIDNVWNQYEGEEKELIDTRKKMLDKVETEYDRLKAAVSYLRDQELLEKKQKSELLFWLDDRWLDLSVYADDRWFEIGHKMDVEWMDASAEVESRWMENGRMLDAKSGKIALRIPSLRTPKIRIKPLRNKPIRYDF
ncbi:VWA domain-containing protein [Brevibacillus sp. B_LB10_24]|uniref:VWA domain-containing protein n=1 Tax=Brevibacillus sp. B_LB10_24 TaxID=3380645 RepID=UPI0038BD5279